MISWNKLTIVFGSSALLLLAAGVSATKPLPAAGGGILILADADNDGLDDLLEFRIGSNPDEADTDGDGLSDLQEIMVGTDFLTPDPPHGIPSSDTALYLNVYSLGADFIIEVYVLNHLGVSQFAMVRAREADQKSFSFGQLASFLVDTTTFAAYDAGWQIDRVRFKLPISLVHGNGSISLAAMVVADYAIMAQVVTLTSVDGVLSQLVMDVQASSFNGHSNTNPTTLGNSGSGTGGGGGTSNPRGGLFPTEPTTDGPPLSGTLDEVCLQVLQPIAYLGAGRIEYQVADAFCDPLAGAVCLTGCSATLGDTIIGIDIVGLLGG
jgi:hypothetical protein